MALQATASESSQQVAAGPASSSRAPFPASRSTTMMSLRAANLSMEADQALYLEPAALRTVGWMGANGATALTHDTGAYHADPVKREEARSERVKLARQARAFVEDVEATLDEAGVPMPRGAPGVSPRNSTAPGVGAFSPAFLRLSTCNSALASPSATSRGSRGSRGTASSAQSPQQKQKAIQQRDDVAVSRAVSTLARSVDEEAVASGQMLVSAFDGSAHCSAARLFEHNVFVHQRMIAIVDEEENMEAEGHIFSTGQSMMSEYGCGTPHAHPNGSAASQAKVRGRRPDSIPKPTDWESIPPSVDANGNEIDRSIVEAANRGYNDSARNSARRLMAHRCFRKHDFVAEHENSVAATTAAALDSCIADGRAATAHSIAVDNQQVGAAVDPDTISDALARSTEVLALAERWTKEATTRGAQEGDAARYDLVASPTSAVPTPKAADAPRTRSEDVEGAAARQAFAAFVNSAALLMAEPVVSAGPVDRWVRQGRIAALRDVALRVKSAAGPSSRQ